MKIGAGDDKNDKENKINGEKEHTDDMGDGVNETRDNKNDKFIEEQDENTQMSLLLFISKKVIKKMTMSLLLIVCIEV